MGKSVLGSTQAAGVGEAPHTEAAPAYAAVQAHTVEGVAQHTGCGHAGLGVGEPHHIGGTCAEHLGVRLQAQGGLGRLSTDLGIAQLVRLVALDTVTEGGERHALLEGVQT